jgi:FtsH-binding integral membrane protein
VTRAFARRSTAAILARFQAKDERMNSQLKKILRWALYGAVVAFVIDWFISSNEILSIRICFGLMVAGAGAVTGALLCANFTADADEPLEAAGGEGPSASSSDPR